MIEVVEKHFKIKMEIKKISWDKKEVFTLIKLREVEELNWEDIKDHFPNRTIEAIKRKYTRCRNDGYKRDRRISKIPDFTNTKKGIDDFKNDYHNNDLTKKEIMKKYKIPSENMFYRIIREHKLHKHSRRK